ncbi:MAG TPA: nitrilase-related carbon-nitrogen hydrolase [Planctomycetota bacterium]|nr:nitrilase-related carbon-nitrogen hydrolase [Planctomycetota bacterium]
MTRRDRTYAAACQLDRPQVKDRDGIRKNVDHLLELTEAAVGGYRPLGRVELVVFPEFAWASPAYATPEELIERLALPAENDHVDRIARKARELGCWIQAGSFLEVDAKRPGYVFNTTLLVGPEGVLSRYRKVNPWIPWEVHASPADVPGYDEDLFPVADTPVGRLGVATCYDWLFPEVTRELAVRGAETLIRISAYMDPWGATPPMDWWTVINRARALENMAFVVAANQGASYANYPPFSWPGGSMIVDYDGRILAQADPGPGTKIVTASLDLAGLRAARAERRMHHLLAHRRPEAYAEQRKPAFRGPPTPDGHRVEELNRRIDAEMRRQGHVGGGAS